MSQLNRLMVGMVYQCLDGEHFTHLDFNVDLPVKGDTILAIELAANSKYRFVLTEESNLISLASGGSQRTATTSETPGDVKATEKRSFPELKDALDRIPHWTSNVWLDLRSRMPGLKEIDEIRRQLEEQFAAIPDPEEYLTKSELDSLNARFEALLAKFADLEAQHSITADELNVVKGEISKMRTTAAQVPKGVWSRMAGNRFVLLCKRIATSPEARSLMLEAAKRLLLPDNSGPNDAG